MAIRGFNQTTLAKAIGTSASHISNISVGDVQPSIQMAKRIAKALDTSMDMLFAIPPSLFNKRFNFLANTPARLLARKTRNGHASRGDIGEQSPGACPNDSQAESLAAGAA